MTKLQTLQKEMRDIKHQMFLSKPLRGYLGNQYSYWEKEKEKTQKKIDKLKKAKKAKK